MGQPSEGLPLQNKQCPLRSETTSGQKNAAHPALVDKSKTASVAYEGRFDKRICENDGKI
jgi:hypothetical protein